LLALAEASEEDMSDEALAACGLLVGRQSGLTGRHGCPAHRLVARMAALRARRGERAAHPACAEALLARHQPKRRFVAMLRGAVTSAGPS
jgi:hypothetical protein